MKPVIYLIVLMLLLSNCKAKIYNQLKFDEKSASDILYGYTKPDAFEKEPFSFWYNFEFDNYQIDSMTIEKIKSKGFDKIEINVVMGTWCSDSQREVPRFIKILTAIGFDINKATIISVDRKKQAEKTKVESQKIEEVPTFIFSRNNKEIDRIIESPKESLEIDMLKIIGG